MVNIKPSRIGAVRDLLATYEHCAAHGIGAYGGGQTELGPGRGQAQYLAALFHPNGPNDLAPSAYNDPDPPPGIPSAGSDPPSSGRAFAGTPSPLAAHWGSSRSHVARVHRERRGRSPGPQFTAAARCSSRTQNSFCG